MNIKDIELILVDFDKVLCSSKLFSEIYSEKFGIDINTMLPFFAEMSKDVTIGKGDLKDKIKNVIDLWQWHGTPEELVNFWINSDTQIDKNLEEKLKEVQNHGVKIFLATNQEKYRGEYIWKELGLNDWMDGKFISFEIGLHKGNPEFFKYVIEHIDICPEKIILFDDKPLFVNYAKSSGMKGVVYNSIDDFTNYFDM